jgi:hypothetical protein
MASIRQFDYDANTRHFTAEMSEIGGFVQIWDDSVDEGVTVLSPATGVTVAFVVVNEEQDREGDITKWSLASVTGKRIDGRFTMTVYND